MTYQIIDNVLSQEQADTIENVMYSTNDFPWFFNHGVTYADNKDFYFVHLFYRNHNVSSTFFYLIEPLIEKLCPRALIRIKGNLYPLDETDNQADWHVDYNYQHSGAIYYVNTNNGSTMLTDGTCIDSVKNRLLIFEPHTLHKSISCTDMPARVNINFNFF